VYSFTPTGQSASGKALSYSIQNKPAWASFNAGTGQLSGTPTAANTGTFANIVIRVTDGVSSASLTAFAITVTPAVLGSATLSWSVPTTNSDGSPLTDLAGYHIYYGTNAASLSEVVNLTTPGATSYVVGNLSAGTYYFDIRAYNSAGLESASSNTASKTI
jgi:hypothetical protein